MTDEEMDIKAQETVDVMNAMIAESGLPARVQLLVNATVSELMLTMETSLGAAVALGVGDDLAFAEVVLRVFNRSMDDGIAAIKAGLS